MAASSSRMRRMPATLAISAQIAIIRRVRERCASFESSYMDAWVEGQLTASNRQLEARVNVRDVDTRQVVEDFESQQRLQLGQQPLQLRKGEGGEEEEEERNGDVGKSKKRRLRSKRGQRKPYSSRTRSVRSALSDSQVVFSKGIPNSVTCHSEYIRYRKCKYIEQVELWRRSLTARLDFNSTNDLMRTLLNLSKNNGTNREWGLLTTQATLMNAMIDEFEIASPKLWLNFKDCFGNDSSRSFVINTKESKKERLQEMETRMGTTILHFTLMQGVNLTKLVLEKCACDSIIKLVSETAVSLKQLNISGSLVTDEGLLHLCGIDCSSSRRSRESLSRKCKATANEALSSIVQNQMPKWLKSRIGCEKLEVLEAKEMKQMKWPSPTARESNMTSSLTTYYNLDKVPIDSGFVAVLDYLKQIRVLHTEVGARAVVAFQRLCRRRRRRRRIRSSTLSTSEEDNNCEPSLMLESLSENELSFAVMEVVARLCPRLTEIRVNGNYKRFYHEEAWMASAESHCNQLSSLHISLKRRRFTFIVLLGARFTSLLQTRGEHLTNICLGEVWTFHYSTLALVKSECPNLVNFTYSMPAEDILSAIEMVRVEKDSNLTCSGETFNLKLAKLQKVYFSAPLGHEAITAFLNGCPSLRSLTLAIEWPGPTLCISQPTCRSDFLGKDYMSQLLSVNKLSMLEELHLMAVYRRGRMLLTNECYEYVLTNLPSLQHLGSFSFWNLRSKDIAKILAKRDEENLDITFDEDLRNSPEDSNFNYRLIPHRSRYACCQGQLLHPRPSAMTPYELLDNVIYELPGMEIPELFEASDDDDDDYDGDDFDDNDHELWIDDDEDEDDDDDGLGGLFGDPNLCVVM